MACAACGFANTDAARFCGNCGTPLATTCPHCRTPLGPGLRFCTSCGEAVAPPEGAPIGSEEASPAERRRVSVLFVDLENFTALAETLDPEEVRTVQSRYFEAARSVIAQYDGTIEKFIGDAVMAVWGAPIAHEDDPERAVRAALAIVDAVTRLGGAASGGTLTARAAVATGEAAVTIGARGQGLVAGDLVNVAARLQSLATSGAVLVDATTRELAPEAAAYESVGALALKGRSAEIAAHRASMTTPGAAGASRGAHTGAFVGRERELRELVELFESVMRDRLSRTVSVTGIAGIGKSRLSWEFGERVEALPHGVAWHAGRAPAYGDGITFAAVAEMVRRRIRVADDADAELTRRQLVAALDEIVRDEGERRWMLPRLSALLGGESDHAFDRDELFAAWRRFFERVSDRSPVVLIFEDLQWADPALLDFIEHLSAWTREHPILIVTLSRPELLDRRPTWGAGFGRFTAIHLERLPDAAMRELLVGRAAHLDEGVVGAILERAGGVPLYAVEVARILADREAAEPPEGFDVPDSLQGLIAARIDALPQVERRLLLAAAVLGRRFRPEALAAVSTTEAADLRERIDGLVRRELLALDDELMSPGNGQLGFVQDLVREVAYRTLARSERRVLHLAAARYLEARTEDEVAESLANHLVEAHRLAPDHADAPRIARRAVAALRRAGHHALRLHVPERALGHLETALRLVESSEQRSAVLEEAATAARAAARLEDAESHLRALVKLHADEGRGPDAARARARLASVLLMAQRNDSALMELETAVAAVGDLTRDAGGAEVASQLARARLLIGDDRAGLEWAERSLEAAERLGLDGIRTDALVTRGTARIRLGDEAGGLADLRRAVDEAEVAGFLTTELRARNNLAWLVVADDPRAAFDSAREGFNLATTMGVGDIAVQLAEVACTVALDTGDWDWALETASALSTASIPEANRINLVAVAAIIGCLAGRSETIGPFEAIQPLPEGTDGQVASGVVHARAWIAFVAGDLDASARLAGEAAEGAFGAERLHQLTLRARAQLWVRDAASAVETRLEIGLLQLTGRATEANAMTLDAGLAALDGSPDAGTAYARAADAWRELDLPLHEGLCALDAHRLLGDPASLDEARRALGGIGAHGLLGMINPRAAPPPSARSRPPRAGTGRRTGAGRRRRPARDRPAQPG